ncbi:MAG: rhomboid family intramembrane serine protease [Deltaproteobacteria bacterium]|nr:rhomboid family intramembrane serine protease [Deltaproteobacteria bacterium]
MVKKIIIASGVVWLLQVVALMTSGVDLGEYFGVSASGVFDRGFVWQPVTYMWLHAANTPFHILLNMFVLYMFGGVLESTWGGRKFLRFYLTTGVGAGVIILLWGAISDPNEMNGFQAVRSSVVTIGASGAVYGVVTAFSLLWPDRTVMLLFPPIPMKAIWFIPLLFVFTFFFGPPNVSHAGHLGGIIVAAFLLRKEARRYFNMPNLRYRWNRYRMRGRLRAVRRDKPERRDRDQKRDGDGDDDRNDRSRWH